MALSALTTVNSTRLLLLISNGHGGTEVSALARQSSALRLVHWTEAATARLGRRGQTRPPHLVIRDPLLKVVAVVFLIRHLHAFVATMPAVTVAASGYRGHFPSLPELGSGTSSHMLLIHDDNVTASLMIADKVIVASSIFLDTHGRHGAAAVVLGSASRRPCHASAALDRS